MRLGPKLFIMSFFTILIPMLIVVFFAALMIYQSTAISQWEYLESIEANLIKDINDTEDVYLEKIKEAADYDFLRDKMYVYEKYWTQLTDSLIAYDLEPVNDFLVHLALDYDIEVISLYRRYHNSFKPIAGYGTNEYLPEVLYKDIVQQDYSRITYKRYADGIYLDIIYPIFSEGKLVGLIQFMRSYNENYMEEIAETFGIEHALILNNAAIFNSNTSTENAVKQIAQGDGDNRRKNFRAGSSRYTSLVIPFNLGGDALGSLVLYMERASMFGSESFLIQRLIAVTLLCILIPVVTFFIKEIRLIRSINSLLTATNEISTGDYSGRVNVGGHDEIGMLSSNFNNMVAVLKKNREDLERQNSELMMKNSYIDAVFQSLRINIIVLDPERRIKVVSKNASSRLELTAKQYGRDFLEVEPFVQEQKLLEKTISDVLSDKNFSRLYSIKFGATSYEMDFYPVIEDTDGITAVVVILNNITERMNIERALMHSDRLASVGQMAAGLAHEINNPMSIILNHVQLLQSDRLNEEEMDRFIKRIESEVKRVSKLINNLLKFSREEKMQPEHISLGEIFSELIGLFDPKATAEIVDEIYDGKITINQPSQYFKVNFKDKQIGFYITEQLLNTALVCGRDSLKQVLFNVIKNAFESCCNGDGIIWLGVEQVNEGTRINLTDNGCGISEDELINVFEMFYTHGKPGTGVGLGLPLCRRLMNNMGGEIGINSIKGQGTTVTMLFPDREGFYG